MGGCTLDDSADKGPEVLSEHDVLVGLVVGVVAGGFFFFGLEVKWRRVAYLGVHGP